MDVLASRPFLSAGFFCLSAAILLRPLLLSSTRPPFSNSRRIIPSPRQSLLPHLTPSEITQLPYPLNALPGSRAVPTPFGLTHIFEFGPPHGERVLLLAGISTPCVSLSSLALALVDRGFRVLLFDYFGRGWSDTPDPVDTDHDEMLYLSQALCALASSEVAWLGDATRGGNGGVHVIGYSFGGGLAVSFASHFPQCVRSVTAIAPGGLMKRSGNSWRTRLLYSRGWFPESVLGRFVRQRFEPSKAVGTRVGKDGENALVEQAELRKDGRGDDPFDDAMVSPLLPNVTVAQVMAWQLEHHRGFIPAIMSAFRYGPIHERDEEWQRLGAFLAERRKDSSLPGLLGGKALLVLGEADSIVKEGYIVPEVKRVLGDDGVEVVSLDAGHEVAITKGIEIADACVTFWKGAGQVGEI
ncbi:hypothetical protein N0V93_009350 [Gnomoniopsis smithogilvyi]|uniref:AB hydrolase-1 domain-containing protein n=1 Tax=Gnomoniopsis smithogilvyi TaxID=1191159 RepID=A0A9W8YKL1_9PEZI|nr:hypothetical protein N0V93_009350 [Gnomoniopsis smithogilvyi]